MENKQKHLEFIQDLIERMSGNSFLLKRWGATIVTALIALGTKEKDINTLLISFIPIRVFWILDGFYLYKERLYRSLYEKIRKLWILKLTLTLIQMNLLEAKIHE